MRLVSTFVRIGPWLAAAAANPSGNRASTRAAESRRLFETLPGPEGRERTIFRVIELAEPTMEPALRPPLERSPRLGGRTRRVVAVGVTLPVVALLATAVAFAYFTSTGVGSGSASVGTLNAPTNVSGSPAGSTVTVSWTDSAGPLTPTGYYVTRSNGGPDLAACGSAPGGPYVTLSCNDTSVPNGSWTYTVTAEYATWTASTSSAPVTVATTATHLAFTVQPSTTVAGVAISPSVTVRVLDTTNTLVTGDNSTQVTLAIGTNPGGGTLSGTLQRTAVGGVATFDDVSINKIASGYTLTAADTTGGGGIHPLSGDTSSTFNITPSDASVLVFSTQPGSATAGAVFGQQPVVRTQDAFGNNSTVGLGVSRNVTVAINSGTGPLQGTATLDIGTGAGNGTVTFTNLRIDLAGAKTLSATAAAGSPTLASVSSGSFTVNAATASVLVFSTQPGSATAGAVFGQQPVVRTQDAFGNNSTVGLGVSRNVTVAINSGTGPLQGTATLDIGTGAGNGTVTFTNLRIDLAGAKTLSATAAAGSPTLASVISGSFTVNAATASVLVFSTQPGSATAGAVFGQQPVVRTQDAFGNNSTVGLGVSRNVTVAINSGTGPLQGTATLDIGTGAGNGTVTFTNLRIDLAGAKTLSATAAAGSPTLASVSSGSFTVNAATASVLVFSTQPGSATAGAVFGQQPVVRTQDAFGNNSTVGLGVSRNVTVAINSGTGPLQGTATLDIGTGAGNGTVTFTNLRIDLAGAKTLSATAAAGSPTLASVSSGSFTVNAATASVLVFSTQPGSATAGAVFGQQPVVRTQDAFGNNSTVGLGVSRNVTVAINSGTGPLQGTATLDIGTGAGNGTVTFTNLRIDLAGAKTLSATAAAGSPTLASVISGSFTVNAATATVIAFVNCSVPTNNTTCTGQPITVGNNGDMTFNIQTQDPYGNAAVAGTAITITFANTDGTFSISAGSPASITAVQTTSGLVTLHHGVNGGTTTLTATPSSTFAPVTLTAKK